MKDNTPKDLGPHRGVSNEEYRRWDAFSITLGLELLQSPAHYKHRLLNPIDQTPSMRFGSLVHMRLLEPARYAREIIIVPEHISRDRRTKDRKEWEASQGLMRTTKLPSDTQEPFPSEMSATVIEAEEAKRIEGIYESIQRKQIAKELIFGSGATEISLLWREGSVLCKGRPDKFHDNGFLIDIKTTICAAPAYFEKEIITRGYHIQAAHYRYGAGVLNIPHTDHVFVVAIETQEPFGIVVYQLDEDLLSRAEEQRQRMLSILRQCELKNEWPAYPDNIEIARSRSWAMESINRALGIYEGD